MLLIVFVRQKIKDVNIYSGSNISEVWPGLQSLCSQVVMVLSRSFLTNQWEQVHSHPPGLHQTFISTMLQIETLTQSKCVIVLLEDLTSLDFASVPKLNSLLKQNVVLRQVSFQKVVKLSKKFSSISDGTSLDFGTI